MSDQRTRYTNRGFKVYAEDQEKRERLFIVEGSHATPPSYPIRVYIGNDHMCLSPVQARIVRDALNEYLNDQAEWAVDEWDWSDE